MALTIGKTERAWMTEALEAEHESLDDAVDAALAVALRIWETRARWAVVGQLARTGERGAIPPDDPEAIKLCVDIYSTEGNAKSAADTLSIAHATNEEYRVWLLPVAHATTAAVLAERRASLQAAEEKRKEKAREKFQESIRKFAADRERAVLEYTEEAA